MATVAYSWEFTLLRRQNTGGKPRVAGRLVIEAPSANAARRAAQEELAKRGDRDSRWSLGVLKPLTPQAPGTSLFTVTFAIWEATDDRFVRHDVHSLDVWACDASAARRIAQQEIQQVDGYVPAWRVRQVVRQARRRRRS